MDFLDDDDRVENQDLRKEPNKVKSKAFRKYLNLLIIYYKLDYMLFFGLHNQDRSDDESESTPIPNSGDNEDDQGTPSPTHDSYNSFEQGDEISDTPSTERTLGENLVYSPPLAQILYFIRKLLLTYISSFVKQESIDVLLSESCRPIILDTQITNQDANVTEVNPEETNPKDLSKSQTTSGPITPTISTQV